MPYVVTRYVPGLSLYHHVAEEGAISGGDLLHFADCLAEALLAVHSVGVLHRDIKPTNVLMEGRSPVLIDFGLARVAEDPRLTQTGWLLGTPGYLAPEILYGDDAEPGLRRARLGRDRGVRGDRPTAVRQGAGDGDHGPRPPRRARPLRHRRAAACRCCASRSDPTRSSDPRCTSCAPRSPTSAAQSGVVAQQSAAAPAPELWTMPFAPAPTPETAHTVDVPLPVESSVPVGPPATLRGQVPVREATPYQQPTPPPASVRPRRPPRRRRGCSSRRSTNPTVRSCRSGRPSSAGPTRAARRSCSSCSVSALLASATVAYAPYLGTALVAMLVLLLRTASVTRQRHGRRQMIRGRARWYDVPKTTLSTPGYLVLALFGSLALIGVGALWRWRSSPLGYLFDQRVAPVMVVAGLGFTAALWWGPGIRPRAGDDARAGGADRAHVSSAAGSWSR